MKKTILALLLASTLVNAEPITVTGYGSTYDSALKNAKTQALEKGASTFIIGESTARNGKVTEQIDQYNGGVIKSYAIVNSTNAFNGYEITITADVVPKDNRVVRESAEFTPNYKEFTDRLAVFDQIDNVGKAITAKLVNPKYEIGRRTVIMNASIVMSFQPKWLSDVKEFSTVINEKGSTSSNTYNRVHGGVVSGLLPVSPLLAVAATAFTEKPQKTSNAMMICFDSSRNCSTVGISFDNIPRSPKLVIIGVTESGHERILYEHLLNTNLYEFYSPGETVTSKYFVSYNVTYKQPTLMLNTKKTDIVDVSFDIDNDFARQLRGVKIYLK